MCTQTKKITQRTREKKIKNIKFIKKNPIFSKINFNLRILFHFIFTLNKSVLPSKKIQEQFFFEKKLVHCWNINCRQMLSVVPSLKNAWNFLLRSKRKNSIPFRCVWARSSHIVSMKLLLYEKKWREREIHFTLQWYDS